MEKFCICCGRRFTARDERQRYCLRPECQRMRKRKWHVIQLATDEDYRQGRIDSQKKWLKHRPSYWREYREQHPAYLERNRTGQVKRNGHRKHDALGCIRLKPEPVIAKTDAAWPLKSGAYRIIPLDGALIAKTDAAIVELSLISTG